MERIHRRKTGRLFLASLDLGCLAAGGNAQCRRDLRDYGESFGLAFQIADDLLDAEGSELNMGKRVGKDAERGKITFPTAIGKELSEKELTPSPSKRRTRSLVTATLPNHSVHWPNGL